MTHRAVLSVFLFSTLSVLFLWGPGTVEAQASFVNWENPHVTPACSTPDESLLLVVNTADNRLEVFDITAATAAHLNSIPVGLDPVSVRARSNTEAWVVNHISDTVSVVDLVAGNVIATLGTDDEPADVIFAGNPERAFVSCSQTNTVLVFDPANLATAPTSVSLQGEDPRALAKSADGSEVYVAIFESGNRSTALGGGAATNIVFPPNVVNDPAGPYGGVNPPPNDGPDFEPPQNGANPAPPAVGMIVKQNAAGQWMDDNGGDWTDLVSGPNAAASGRPVGWELLDHDVAVIDANGLGVTYVEGLMNLCMHLSVHPNGQLAVVGTEALNEVRFEPVLNGTFLRVQLAFASPSGGAPVIHDLNPHLDYLTPTVGAGLREQSIGDPRGIVWNAAGTKAYVTGKGSNNVVVVDATGNRAGVAPTIEVGEGPTGIVLDEGRDRLYVVNHFDASVSVVDLTTELEIARSSFYDPTPAAIQVGRKHLYDTHETSGLGFVSCASCHADARMDQLAWDLGAPDGDMKAFNQNCIDFSCQDWHPMKGPMTTQTLQDIIGKEPHHWRGDRDGIEEFNGAFEGLLGDDEQLTPTEMQEFEDFLASIHFPPNPFRNFDNSLPTSLPLPGHYTTGLFGPEGLPLPNGNAQIGLTRYRTANLDAIFQCVTCHTLPTGAGTDLQLQGFQLVPVPPGPNGERHLAINGLDGSTNVSMKVPQLRNLYEKVGMDLTQPQATKGFGYLHDGSIDSIARFLTEPAFSFVSVQDVANQVAFMLAFSGSDLPTGSTTNVQEPLGPTSQDSHAAVGAQVTLDGTNNGSMAVQSLLADMQTLADAGAVGWIAKGTQGGIPRGYAYLGGGMFQSDRSAELVDLMDLINNSTTGSEVTFTVVPPGMETRVGIDRDEDGFFDRDELDVCADPADPSDFPPGPGCGAPLFVRGDCNGDGGIDISDPIRSLAAIFGTDTQPDCLDACDLNDDGSHDIADPVYGLAAQFSMGSPPAAPTGACGIDPTGDMLDCVLYAPCP